MALGLSPIQTKMTVELPNAVRTTLPSIVSVFIGLWKDTTLLFIVNILDFFKLAKDLPNTDLRFLGDFLEPLYVTAIVFWVFAFYLSRLSKRDLTFFRKLTCDLGFAAIYVIGCLALEGDYVTTLTRSKDGYRY